MKKQLVGIALGVSLLSLKVLHAFESTCVSGGNQTRFPQTGLGMMSRTCAGTTEVESVCNTPFDQARGAMMSEHAWLAHEGMRRAGLSAFYDDPSAGPLNYYISEGAKTVNGGALDSVEPAVPGRMDTTVIGKRVRNTVPEFAEVPDFSYSLSDFILGNEHVFAENCSANDATTGKALWRDQEKEIEACHDFNSHRGSVNSTHFSPQNRASYSLYHGLALATADACKKVSDALGVDSVHVAACEKEALTFEAVGAHYLADAWSAGHMWQRWGSPNYGATPIARFRDEMVAMMSGIIHGWRDVARQYSETASIQNDQLCMSGFFLNNLSAADQTTFNANGSNADLEHRYSDAMVQWTYPSVSQSGVAQLFFAGGDEYLFLCQNANPNKSSGAYLNQSRWAVSASDDTASAEDWPLATQYRRALTCLAYGMGEVYDRGPKTVGDRATVSNFDPLITADPVDQQDLCWNMRVTNLSMQIGAQISNGLDGEVSFADPSFATRVISEVLPALGDIEEGDEIGLFQTLREEPKFRAAMATMGMALSKLAAQNKYDTQAAELNDPNLQKFYHSRRNSEYVPLIQNDQVSYFERHNKATWTPQGLITTTLCDVDSDCGIAEYCSYTNATAAAASSGSSKQCVRHEMAIMRAFREGEVAFFCAADIQEDLNAVRTACLAGVSQNTDACQACVQVVRPHLRAMGKPSECDLLQSSGLVNTPAATTAVSISSVVSTDPGTAALAFCQTP